MFRGRSAVTNFVQGIGFEYGSHLPFAADLPLTFVDDNDPSLSNNTSSESLTKKRRSLNNSKKKDDCSTSGSKGENMNVKTKSSPGKSNVGCSGVFSRSEDGLLMVDNKQNGFISPDVIGAEKPNSEVCLKADELPKQDDGTATTCRQQQQQQMAHGTGEVSSSNGSERSRSPRANDCLLSLSNFAASEEEEKSQLELVPAASSGANPNLTLSGILQKKNLQMIPKVATDIGFTVTPPDGRSGTEQGTTRIDRINVKEEEVSSPRADDEFFVELVGSASSQGDQLQEKTRENVTEKVCEKTAPSPSTGDQELNEQELAILSELGNGDRDFRLTGVRKSQSGRFEASVYDRTRRKKVYVGMYSSMLEAARARDQKAIELGAVSTLNFPETKKLPV
jgi:hypothetical protein